MEKSIEMRSRKQLTLMIKKGTCQCDGKATHVLPARDNRSLAHHVEEEFDIYAACPPGSSRIWIVVNGNTNPLTSLGDATDSTLEGFVSENRTTDNPPTIPIEGDCRFHYT